VWRPIATESTTRPFSTPVGVKIAPDFYMAHNNLGSDFLSKSDFSAARNEFQQASR
jgi:hypothetical protein